MRTSEYISGEPGEDNSSDPATLEDALALLDRDLDRWKAFLNG